MKKLKTKAKQLAKDIVILLVVIVLIPIILIQGFLQGKKHAPEDE